MTGKTEPRLWTRPLAELTETNTLGFACIDPAAGQQRQACQDQGNTSGQKPSITILQRDKRSLKT